MSDSTSWRVQLASGAGSTVIAALLRTVNFHDDVHADSARLIEEGKRVVYAFWHGGLLPLAFRRRQEGMAVLVSQHRDGEVIAKIAHDLGYVTARGSSTRGHVAALRGLLRRAREGRDIAVTPDGPQGPREIAQAGVVEAARLTGFSIVPVGAAADRAWELKSWDRFMIPKPFANVFIRYGAPLEVDGSPESALADVQRGLDEATARARAAADT